MCFLSNGEDASLTALCLCRSIRTPTAGIVRSGRLISLIAMYTAASRLSAACQCGGLLQDPLLGISREDDSLWGVRCCCYHTQSECTACMSCSLQAQWMTSHPVQNMHRSLCKPGQPMQFTAKVSGLLCGEVAASHAVHAQCAAGPVKILRRAVAQHTNVNSSYVAGLCRCEPRASPFSCCWRRSSGRHRMQSSSR